MLTIDEEAKRISLSYKETLTNPWRKLDDLVGKAVDVKIKKITDKAIFRLIQVLQVCCIIKNFHTMKARRS